MQAAAGVINQQVMVVPDRFQFAELIYGAVFGSVFRIQIADFVDLIFIRRVQPGYFIPAQEKRYRLTIRTGHREGNEVVGVFYEAHRLPNDTKLFRGADSFGTWS